MCGRYAGFGVGFFIRGAWRGLTLDGIRYSDTVHTQYSLQCPIAGGSVHTITTTTTTYIR